MVASREVRLVAFIIVLFLIGLIWAADAVNIISPISGVWISGDTTNGSLNVTFNFTSDSLGETPCNLLVARVIEGEPVFDSYASNGSVINDTQTIIGFEFNESIAINDTYWKISCTDIGSSTDRYATIDLTLPNNSVSSPVNGTWYNTDSVTLTFSPLDALSPNVECNYTLDGDLNEIGFVANGSTSNTEISALSNSTHVVNVTCMDHAGNFNISNNVEFVVDGVSPVVVIYPDNPTDGRWYNITNNPINIQFNVTDNFDDDLNCTEVYQREIFQGIGTAWSDVSSALVGSLGNATANITNFTVVSDGNHSLVVYCSDNAGNTGSASRYFGSDVNAPSLGQPVPADENKTTNPNVSFEFTIGNEYYPGMNLTCMSDVDATGTTIFVGETSSQTLTNTSSYDEGFHQIRFNCTDRGGNTGNTTVQSFIVDQTEPGITINSPDDNIVVNNTYMDFNFTVVDALVNTSVCTVTVSKDDGTTFTGTNSSVLNNTPTTVTISNIVDHSLEWWVNCSDFLGGNTNGSEVRTINFPYNTSFSMAAVPSLSQQPNETVYFYVNYTNVTNNVQLNESTPVCNITLYNISEATPETVVANTAMPFNTSFNYTWNSSFDMEMTWNVTCIKEGYVNRTGADTYSITTRADLYVVDYTVSNAVYSENGTTLSITAGNRGQQNASDVNVTVYWGDIVVTSYLITLLELTTGQNTTTYTWDTQPYGSDFNNISIVVDPWDNITEASEENNNESIAVEIIQNTAIYAWDNITNNVTREVVVYASYNLTNNTVSDVAVVGGECNITSSQGNCQNTCNMSYNTDQNYYWHNWTYGAGLTTWSVSCTKYLFENKTGAGSLTTTAPPTMSDLTMYSTFDWRVIAKGGQVYWNVENVSINVTVTVPETASMDTVWLNISRTNTTNTSLNLFIDQIATMTNVTATYTYTYTVVDNVTYNVTAYANDTLAQEVLNRTFFVSSIKWPEVLDPGTPNVEVDNNITLNFTVRASFNITNVTLHMWQAGANASISNVWITETMIQTSGGYSPIFSYNFTNTSIKGDYYINVTAFDSKNVSGSYLGYVEVWTASEMNGTLETATNFTFYRPGTSTVLANSNYSSGDTYNISLHNRSYDLVVDVGGASLKFYNISLEALLRDKLKVAYIDANDTDVRLPMTRENRGFTGFYIYSQNLTFRVANVTLSYPASASSGRVRIYRCSTWNETANCTSSSDWTDIYITESAELSFDFTNRLVTTEVTSFSAYVAGESSCGDNSCDSSWGETTGTCGSDCRGGGNTGGSTGGGGSSVTAATTTDDENGVLEIGAGAESEDLIVGTDSIKIELYQGEEGIISLRVRNPADETKTLTISASPSIKNLVEFEPESLTLEPGAVSYFDIFVRPSLTTEVKSYFGEFLVTDGISTDRATANIIILESRERLLDIEISPLADVIHPGEELEIEVNLFVFGDISKLYTRVVLQLIDQDIREVVEEVEKNILVQTSYSEVAKMNISSDIRLGRYLVKGIATYTDANNVTKEVVDLTYITVEQPFLLRSIFGVPVWAIILGILMMGLGGFLVYIYEKKKVKEKRYLDKIDFSQLPQPGPNAAFIGKIAESDMRAFLDLDKFKVHSLVAGATGSGKTIAAQVMVEEALKKGISVVVLDPTAQWTGFLRPNKNEMLFKLYPGFNMKRREAKAFKGNLHIVESEHEEIDFKNYLKRGGSVTVFCLNRLTPHQIDIFVTNSIKTVFKADLDESQKLRLLIVYDEIHRLLPKFGGTGEGFIQVERACREFRKWGIGLIMISQVLSDFKGEIKANIGTEVQMRTRYEDDLERIKLKYGEDVQKSVLKASLGTGMIQNAMYNRGRPYFTTFRPIYHSLHRLTNEELSLYQKYNRQIEELRGRLVELKKQGVDIFDVELELNLAQSRLERGAFNIVDIYLESIRTRVDKYKAGDKVL